jgi:hypothetical protein
MTLLKKQAFDFEIINYSMLTFKDLHTRKNK